MSQNETKEEKAQQKWMGYLALSTAIMAVLAALTTLYMGKFSSRAIMNQGLESDQMLPFLKTHQVRLREQQPCLHAIVARHHKIALKPAQVEIVVARLENECNVDVGSNGLNIA